MCRCSPPSSYLVYRSLPIYLCSSSISYLVYDFIQYTSLYRSCHAQVFSTMATADLDEVAATGHPHLVFQLYVVRSRCRAWF
jgi:hypothetical protein